MLLITVDSSRGTVRSCFGWFVLDLEKGRRKKPKQRALENVTAFRHCTDKLKHPHSVALSWVQKGSGQTGRVEEGWSSL